MTPQGYQSLAQILAAEGIPETIAGLNALLNLIKQKQEADLAKAATIGVER